MTFTLPVAFTAVFTFLGRLGWFLWAVIRATLCYLTVPVAPDPICTVT